MKIGLDIHGTIDAHRSFFAEWTTLLMRDNERRKELGLPLHEVHVLTGPSEKRLKPNELEGIAYTHFFSIVDHCNAKGVCGVCDAKGDFWCDQYEWNRAKGDYAREHNLDLMIDDSKDYPNFFSTPIATFQSRKEWMQKGK